MNAAPDTVSVVICCYSGERLGDLLDAVDSVQGQTRPATEIAVVVDHNPALLEHLTAERPELLIVPNTEPVGLSGARNSGIAATTGEIVAFLDDDAVAEPDWLEHLMTSRLHVLPAAASEGGGRR